MSTAQSSVSLAGLPMTAAMGDPAWYQRDGAAITADTEALAAVQAELDAAYARWAELE